MSAFPTGTLTFLFTDMEGSTRLVQALGERHGELVIAHARLLREAFLQAGGLEVGERGDGFFFVFRSVPGAVEAAAAAQRALAGYPWPRGVEVKVRMGLHTGEGSLAGGSYVGLAVHRAARVADAGHGGQVLLSAATAALVQDGLPQGLSLRPLGTHRLKDLPGADELFQLVIEGLVSEFPPLRSQRPAASRLPTPLSCFVGRERELGEVRAELSRTRLLTLTGPGGIGKTRLSLQAAAESGPDFADGVFFVPLAQVRDPNLLAPAILSALGLPPRADDPRSAVHAYLAPRELLLVLDNFEQLLGAAAQVGECLQAAPALKVLVTSRAPLHVYGEREYPVPPLDLQAPGLPPAAGKSATAVEWAARSEAVALFAARAADARPGFALTEQNAAVVAEIASRLDGLPLAIELAAARVRIMPPEAILPRLSSRLTLLTGGARDLPDRLQTLRGAIAWSYDLLEEPVQRLFARLAVFHGGAGLAEVEAVCRPMEELGLDPLDGLAALVDHSLLRQAQAGGEPRFSMLETIREFAFAQLEQSGELERLAERHTQAFAALAQAARPHLTRARRREWLQRLEGDLDNLRAALVRLLQHREAGRAQQMVAALWRFWLMRAHLQEGRERAEESLKLFGSEPSERIAALSAAGSLAYWQTDAGAAHRWFEEAVAMAREAGERRTLALTLYDYGFGILIGGDVGRALALVGEGLTVARELGEPEVVGELLCALATLRWRAGSPDAALPLLDEALEVLTGSDSVHLLSWARAMRGNVRLAGGDIEGAREDYRQRSLLYDDSGDLGSMSQQLIVLANLALAQGHLERALRLRGAAEAAQEASQIRPLVMESLAKRFAEAAEQVGEERAAELVAEGRLMPIEQAAAYAMEGLSR